jgi:dipeptidyl aminopeptidase/acylaminoacyl peptidase
MQRSLPIKVGLWLSLAFGPAVGSIAAGASDRQTAISQKTVAEGIDPVPKKTEARRAETRLKQIFGPLATETAALSPDGRRIAYTLRSGEEIAIVVLELDHPTKARARVVVNTDTKATSYPNRFNEKSLARVRWLQWVTNERLVFETNWADGLALISLDADGRGERVLATHRTAQIFGSTPQLLGASTREANSVLIRITYPPKFTGMVRFEAIRGVPPLRFTDNFRLNAETGKFTAISDNDCVEEMRSLAARQSASQREWPAVGATLRTVLPQHHVTVLASDGSFTRFLARVETPADPGSFYVFDRSQNKAWDLIRCLPEPDADRRHASSRFTHVDPDGKRVPGVLTLPDSPRVAPAPVVVLVPESRKSKATLEYRPEVRAFAEMGFAVVQFDGHSSADETDRSEVEWERQQVGQMARVLDGLIRDQRVGSRAILFGTGQGAGVALRTLQTFPRHFRGAVLLSARMHPAEWDDPARWPNPDPDTQPARQPPIGQPVLMLQYAGNQRNWLSAPQFTALGAVARSLREAGTPVTLVGLREEFHRKFPGATANAYAQIEEFLMATAFDYEVRTGEPVPVKDP